MQHTEPRFKPVMESYTQLKNGKATSALRLPAFASPAQETALAFWNSYFYFPILLVICAVFLMLGEVLTGILVMVAIASFLLVFCDDMLASLFPFLMIFLIAVDAYEDLGSFTRYWYCGIPFVAALIYHMVVYAKPLRRGVCFRGLVVVSAATALGGIGRLPLSAYFRPMSLYYTLGLGAAMLIVYLGARSQLTADRGYPVLDKFLSILFFMGVFTTFLVFRIYAQHWKEFLRDFATLPFVYRNYAATVLLLAMPTSFYKALRRPAYLICTALFFLAMLLTGSRSGLVFGTLQLLAGILYLLRFDRERGRLYRKIVILAAVPALIVGYYMVESLYSTRFIDGNFIGKEDDVRVHFLMQSLRDFNNNPLFGQGLGNTSNKMIFEGVPGSMIWYHNWLAQIIGSMGILGLLAYGIQISERFYLIVHKMSPVVMVAALSYFGIFLMSFTNPGEFCPLPNEMLVVILFALLEDCPDRDERKPLLSHAA